MEPNKGQQNVIFETSRECFVGLPTYWFMLSGHTDYVAPHRD